MLTFVFIIQITRYHQHCSCHCVLPKKALLFCPRKATWLFLLSRYTGTSPFLFIYLLFTHDSLFNYVELLSLRVLLSLRNTYRGALQNYQWLAIFTIEGGGLNSESFDTNLNALTGRHRIH